MDFVYKYTISVSSRHIFISSRVIFVSSRITSVSLRITNIFSRNKNKQKKLFKKWLPKNSKKYLFSSYHPLHYHLSHQLRNSTIQTTHFTPKTLLTMLKNPKNTKNSKFALEPCIVHIQLQIQIGNVIIAQKYFPIFLRLYHTPTWVADHFRFMKIHWIAVYKKIIGQLPLKGYI